MTRGQIALFASFLFFAFLLVSSCGSPSDYSTDEPVEIQENMTLVEAEDLEESENETDVAAVLTADEFEGEIFETFDAHDLVESELEMDPAVQERIEEWIESEEQDICEIPEILAQDERLADAEGMVYIRAFFSTICPNIDLGRNEQYALEQLQELYAESDEDMEKGYSSGTRLPQVILVCKKTYLGGPCAFLSKPCADLSSKTYFSPFTHGLERMNNNIRTLVAFPHSTAIFCQGKYYRKECRNFISLPYSLELPFYEYSVLGIYVDIFHFEPLFIKNGVGSLRIWDNDDAWGAQPLWSTTDFTINNQDEWKEEGPWNRYPAMSTMGLIKTGEFQGVAHSDRQWWFVSKGDMSVVDISQDLNEPSAIVAQRIRIFGSHWGDPDYYEKTLYVPNYNEGTDLAYIEMYQLQNGTIYFRDWVYLEGMTRAG